ncbi:MAG: PKD domain-containing protein [Bacteroidaceae bacterium]
MKKLYIHIPLLITLACLLFACSPSTENKYSLGETPQAESLAFEVAPQSNLPNRVVFKNTSKIAGVSLWDFGNGSTAKGSEVQTDFPMKGDYTVTMTLYTEGGSSEITQEVSIAADDFSLLDTPYYRALTGGPDALNGKTWVFDQYHDGHFGVGPANGSGPDWWSCPAMGKDDTSLYTQRFTFIQNGVQLKWENNGYIYANASGRDILDSSITEETADGDFDIPYVPAEMLNFSMNEAAGTLTLSGDAFFGQYQAVSNYKILSLTEHEMYLYCTSGLDGNGWFYRLIPEDENIEPIVNVAVKAVPFADDMEVEESTVIYEPKEMGDSFKTKRGYDNPLPVAINTSSKVFLYEKTDSYYSNLLIPDAGYKYDLTDQHIIKMKVYLPSYNDYTTEGTVAGDWIAVKNLQKKVSVKLQDSTLGGNSWSTQAEISVDNLETDKWIELTFDFSEFADRKDFDSIVIQFGGEGHSMAGLFFFDDLSFD